jgi:hypothetical protein
MRAVAITFAIILGLPAVALGDGGTLRLVERQGNYQISAFTSPTPARAGPVDISVLVQDAGGEIVDDAQITVRVAPVNQPQDATIRAATAAAATNKLFRSAIFDLPTEGRRHVEIAVTAAAGGATVGFDMDVEGPLPPWLAFWPWVLWPIGVVALFGVHQILIALHARRREEKLRFVGRA